MIQETFLFIEEAKQKEAADTHIRQLVSQRKSWKTCWGWSGPEVDGYGEVNQICCELMPGQMFGPPNFAENFTGPSIYCYMEQVRFIRQIDDEHWEAVIDMGIVHDRPWYKDGIRLKMHVFDIWAPTRKLREERNHNVQQ